MGEDECEGYAEIITYDTTSNTAFYVNAVDSSVDMISLDNPHAPAHIQTIDVSSYGEPNSIAISNGVVAMAVANGSDDMANGHILTYSTAGVFLNAFEAGVLPDMVTFTHSGDYILSANEGQPNDDYDVDPEGSMTVVEVATGTVTQVDFTSFNDQRAALIDAGVRLYANPGSSTVAQDLEPEYIAVSTDDSTAYIAFQENNAFGIFDLEDMELDSIVALGTKDYSEGCYDLSDRDGGVEFTCGQPVSSMYMPDAIALFNSGGNDYIVTANEGDGREYEGEPGYTDEDRGDDLTLNATYWSERGYDAAAQTELLLDENLGRLKVSIADGDHDGDGEHEEIVGYGARSMTIWDANGELVFDTGDQISHLTQTYGEYINGYTASRNDDKGAEPEGVTTGSYDGTDYAFLGLERAGGVMVYDLTNPSRAMFDQYITFPNHVSPEGLTFVDASDSPTNQPLLLVANEVSGTIAIISPVHQSVPSHAPGDDQPCLASDTGAHLAVDCGNQLNVMGDSDVHWTLVGQYDSGLGEGASEISAYDAGSHRSFVVNAVTGSIDILDMSNPTDPYLLHRLSITNGEPNSVDVHDGLVAVAVAGVGEEGSGMSKQDAGHVMFFDTDGNMVSNVIAGALPDMVTFTPDGNGVLVANEGEPNDMYTIDPEGTLSYVDLSGGDASTLTQSDVTQINFNAFESQRATLATEGVRMFGPNANLSQDLEPEYIAVSPDGTHAMVVLQENNAFAKVDLTTLTVTDIVAMGMKDYSLGMYDFSDKDDGANLATYANVYGMYMPDALSTFSVGGSSYYVTANEGDARDYWFDAADEAACLAAGGLEYDDEDGCLAYSEEVRLDDLDLDDTVFPNEDDLLDKEALGRLKTTTANNCGDTDNDGDLDFICSYGTRSFSIWDSNGALVWDSGDSISALMISQGEYINSYTEKRNDDKGAEPEGVVVGEMFGKTYAFVGLERAGGILVYDVSDPTAPVFDQYIYLPDHVSPEGLDFISAADSPNGAAMLVVAHEVSGTVAILQPFV